jgi:hypothetical protein
VLLDTMSVREALNMAATLKLPQGMGAKEKVGLRVL